MPEFRANVVVYVNDPDNRAARTHVLQLLNDLKDQGLIAAFVVEVIQESGR